MEPGVVSAGEPFAAEQQRPVITRACDACRKKKIRCEPDDQGCAQCAKYGTRCHFTPIATRTKPRRPANFKYITHLEKRLSQMEDFLQKNSSTQPVAVPSSGLFSDQMTDLGGPLQPQSIANLCLRVLDRKHDQVLISGTSTQSGLMPGPYFRPAFQRLPVKAVALELVKESFSSYNKYVPLFDEEEFLHDFDLKYDASTPEDPGWWGCINVVLSLAHRLRALRTSDPAETNALAGGYFQNALAIVSELNVSHRNLPAIQALLGMASILQGTPNPESSSVLAAAALRLAQNMDLHRECSNEGTTPPQAEQRRRIFWIAYILDKDISLRLKRPFSQDDDDMDVNLPSQTPIENSGCNATSLANDLLNYRIGLAVIQGQVYKQLYSVHASRQSGPQRAIAAQELSSSLAYWKSIAQTELLEEFTILPSGHLSEEMIHKVVLRLTYIHCLAMIDQHLPPSPQPTIDQQQIPLELLTPSENECIFESRKAIRLLGLIPDQDCACVWMLLHAFFAAATTILRNLSRNPASPEAHLDLHLVNPLMRLLHNLRVSQGSGTQPSELVQMTQECDTLSHEAKEAVQLFGTPLF